MRVASCAMVLAVSSQSLVRAEEHRTAANALLCASPLTIKDAYQAVLASDRKWLQELNCIQAKAGLKVTVIERNSLGWQVRVNAADNSIKLPQTEHTATIGGAEWTARPPALSGPAQILEKRTNRPDAPQGRREIPPLRSINAAYIRRRRRPLLATCCSGRVGWNFGQLTDHISTPKVAR